MGDAQSQLEREYLDENGKYIRNPNIRRGQEGEAPTPQKNPRGRKHNIHNMSMDQLIREAEKNRSPRHIDQTQEPGPRLIPRSVSLEPAVRRGRRGEDDEYPKSQKNMNVINYGSKEDSTTAGGYPSTHSSDRAIRRENSKGSSGGGGFIPGNMDGPIERINYDPVEGARRIGSSGTLYNVRNAVDNNEGPLNPQKSPERNRGRDTNPRLFISNVPAGAFNTPRIVPSGGAQARGRSVGADYPPSGNGNDDWPRREPNIYVDEVLQQRLLPANSSGVNQSCSSTSSPISGKIVQQQRRSFNPGSTAIDFGPNERVLRETQLQRHDSQPLIRTVGNDGAVRSARSGRRISDVASVNVDALFDGYQNTEADDERSWKQRYEEELRISEKARHDKMDLMEENDTLMRKLARAEDQIKNEQETKMRIMNDHDHTLHSMSATINDQKTQIELLKVKEKENHQRILSLEKQVDARDSGSCTDSDSNLYSKEIERLNKLVAKRESDLENIREMTSSEMMALQDRIEELKNELARKNSMTK